MANQPVPVPEQPEAHVDDPKPPAEDAVERSTGVPVDEVAIPVASDVDPQANATEDAPTVTASKADPTADEAAPDAHVEVPSGPVADSGAPVAQWVGAGLLAVILAGAVLAVLRKSAPQLALPSTMGSPQPVEDTPAPISDSGLVSRFREALTRTGAALRDQFDGLFGRPIDEQLFEDLEEVLLVADVGMPTANRIIEKVRAAASDPDPQPEVLREAMRSEMRSILDGVHAPLLPHSCEPWVVLVVGVNGSGKTTTIGKLAARYRAEGKSVLVAAGDTYRAAATEQLAVWAERSGAEIVKGKDGSDPGAVVYDALTAAKARDHDVVLVDTAGRLQTAKPLMDQLAKIRRVIGKVVPTAPHETLLVVDGTIGQNAMSQAKLFNEATPLSGVVITKLDGTAKGGMILALASEMRLSVKLVGVGEQIDDLRDFDSDVFIDAVS